MQSIISNCSLQWPVDLNQIKFKQADKDFVTIFVQQIIKTHTFKKESTFLIISKKNIYKVDKFNQNLPVSITIILDQGKITNIILMLNGKRGKVFKSGAQQKPKTCYDLITGKFLVKKRIFEKEGGFVSSISKKNLKGISHVVALRELQKNGIKKTQYFEYLCEGTLEEYIGTPHLLRTQSKIEIIRDLIAGMRTIHHISSKQTISTSSENITITHTTIHRDIKPANILVTPSHAFIADFGLVNLIHETRGTPPYMHPALQSLGNSTKQRVLNTAQYGGKFDMWAVGLILVEIILNRFSQKAGLKGHAVPPLEFIESKLDKKKIPPNQDFVFMTQAEIDQEMEMHKHNIPRRANAYVVRALMDLAHSMLKINPDLIITADEAAFEIEEILSISTPHKLRQKILAVIREIKNTLRKLSPTYSYSPLSERVSRMITLIQRKTGKVNVDTRNNGNACGGLTG